MRELVYFKDFLEKTISHDPLVFGGAAIFNFHFRIEFHEINTRLTKRMSKYFKFLNQLLALSGESFEDELRRLVRLNFIHTNAYTITLPSNHRKSTGT